jgi:eukaryotic-like serine/threonine-protein kinase
MRDLAQVVGSQGKNDESERLIRECLQLVRKVDGPEHPHALITLGDLAAALDRLGRLDEAESLFRQCLESKRRIMGA